jgi:hypothetical protein
LLLLRWRLNLDENFTWEFWLIFREFTEVLGFGSDVGTLPAYGKGTRAGSKYVNRSSIVAASDSAAELL